MISSDSFSSDPEFCSDCGAILPLPGRSDHITCKVCGHAVDSRQFDSIEVKTVITFDTAKKKRLDQADNAVDGPLVDRKCPKCNHEGMSYATLQTRSADEGQTVFYTCPKCKFKEIENS